MDSKKKILSLCLVALMAIPTGAIAKSSKNLTIEKNKKQHGRARKLIGKWDNVFKKIENDSKLKNLHDRFNNYRSTNYISKGLGLKIWKQPIIRWI